MNVKLCNCSDMRASDLGLQASAVGRRKSEVLSLLALLSFFTFSLYAAPVLDGSGIRIEFDSAESGFDCLAIKNKLGGETVQFGDGASEAGREGLWSLKFWKDGNPSQNRWLTNHSPSSRSLDITNGVARLSWKGLSLADEKNVIDVTATVSLSEDGASAQWRISVENRSKTWGLAEVIPVGEVPMVDVKWDRDKVGEFKVPAVFGAVWRNGNGDRRVFVVNISGEEQPFKFRAEPEGKPFAVVVPPRSTARLQPPTAQP